MQARNRLAAVVLWIAVAGPCLAQVSRDQALASVFPDAEVRAERVFLTSTQRQQAGKLAGVDIPTSLIARYVAIRDGKVIGRAYVDTHNVRTKNESLLISLDERGRVKRIEVTAFLEPPEYQASRAWYDQYVGKNLTDDLRLHRAIRPLAGASLTAKATTEATRRVLAIDEILQSGSTQ
jgi:electron transport complex protein RnfG